MSALRALAVVACGCGRIGFTVGDGGDPPVGEDARAPLPLGPFDTPTRIEPLTPLANLDDPTVSADLLELYVESEVAGGPGGADIWVSRRSVATDPWGAPSPDVQLSSTAIDSCPGIGGDGLQIWLCSDRGSPGVRDIWTATRPDTASAWSPPEHVPELSSAASDMSPEPHTSGLVIVFMSNRRGAGDLDLYISMRPTTTSAWSPPTEIAEVNTDGDEFDPFLTADQRHLLFSAIRPDGQGERDIYVASRATPAGPFGIAVPLVDLNSQARDTDIWLSPDLTYAVFVSDRDGIRAVYEARRRQ